MIVLDVLDAPNTGTHCDPDQMPVFLGNLEAGVPDRIDAGGDAVVHERVVLALILGRQVVVHVEIANQSRDPGRKVARIEVFDQRDAGAPFTDVIPRIGQPAADRRNDTHPGDDDASLTQWGINQAKVKLPKNRKKARLVPPRRPYQPL